MQYVIAPTSDYLAHSAKGSEWKKHIYIKRVDGTYYYPDSYKGGRHLPDSNTNKDIKTKKTTDEKEEKKESSDVVSKISDLTGMKEESCERLIDIAKTKGVDSDEYKELLSSLSEGDDEQRIRINNLVQTNMENNTNDKTDGEGEKLSEQDIENLAKEVISGNFGNGNDRKERFGDYYQDVQNKVNEMMRSNGSKISSKKPSNNKSSDEKKEKDKKSANKVKTGIKTIKHGIEFPAYVVKPSKKIIYW